MRKLLVVALAIAPALASAAIVNSKHDLTFTGNSIYVTGQRSYQTVCSFCHSPHHAMTTRGLWVRRDPSAAAFIAPTTTLGTSLATTTADLKNSKQCLSCHDGSVAVNETVSYPITATGPDTVNGTASTIGAVTNQQNAGSATISTGSGTYFPSLEGTHPVSVPYPPVGAVAGQYANVSNTCQPGIAICTDSAQAGDGVSLKPQLSGGQTVECQSCHDVHGSGATVATNHGMFLRASWGCTSCHNK